MSDIKINNIIAAMRNEAVRTCTITVVAASHSGIPKFFLEGFEVSVAIERLNGLTDRCWSEAIAVGSLSFVEKVKSKL